MKKIILSEQKFNKVFQEYTQDEWNDAWEEYERMNMANLPEDESDFDEVIPTSKKDMGKLGSPFGTAYAHSVYKGKVDPMIKKVRGNTLRSMMG